MLISYDADVDALHIELGSTRPVTSREVARGMSIDLDDKGNIVGLEILEATECLGEEALQSLTVEGLTTIVRNVESSRDATEPVIDPALTVQHESHSASTGK